MQQAESAHFRLHTSAVKTKRDFNRWFFFCFFHLSQNVFIFKLIISRTGSTWLEALMTLHGFYRFHCKKSSVKILCSTSVMPHFQETTRHDRQQVRIEWVCKLKNRRMNRPAWHDHTRSNVYLVFKFIAQLSKLNIFSIYSSRPGDHFTSSRFKSSSTHRVNYRTFLLFTPKKSNQSRLLAFFLFFCILIQTQHHKFSILVQVCVNFHALNSFDRTLACWTRSRVKCATV